MMQAYWTGLSVCLSVCSYRFFFFVFSLSSLGRIFKSSSFLDVMPCGPVEVRRYFWGTYCHRLHRRWVANKKQAASQAVYFLGLLFDNKAGYSMFLWNVGEFYRTIWTFNQEDSIFHSDCCDDLKSNRKDIVSSVSAIIRRLRIKLWRLNDVE